MNTRALRTLGLGFTLILLVLSTTGCGLTKAKIPATIKITPDTATIKAGQQAEILIEAENVKNLFGVELTVEYAPHILDVMDADPNTPEVQITAGDFLVPDMIATNRTTDGKIEFAIVQVAPSKPVDGSGTLARVLLKGETAGTTALTISAATFFDENNNVLAVATQGGTVTVEAGDVAVQPTPTLVLPTPTPATEQATATAAPTVAPENVNCGRVIGHHVVKAGESLYSIGRVYATQPQAIAACNNLSDPGNIHIGNQLAIPYAPWSPIPPGPVAERQFTPEP